MGSSASTLCSCLSDDARPSSRAKGRKRNAPNAASRASSNVPPDVRASPSNPLRSVQQPSSPQQHPAAEPRPAAKVLEQQRLPQHVTPPSVSVTPPRELFQPEPLEQMEEDLPAPAAVPTVSFELDGGEASGANSTEGSTRRLASMRNRRRTTTEETNGSGGRGRGGGTLSPHSLTMHGGSPLLSSPQRRGSNPLSLPFSASSGSLRSHQSLRNSEPHTVTASKVTQPHEEGGGGGIDETAQPHLLVPLAKRPSSGSIVSTVTTSRTQSMNLGTDSLRQGSSQRQRWAGSLSASGPQNSDEALRTSSRLRGYTESTGGSGAVKFRPAPSSVPETSFLSTSDMTYWEPLQLDLASSHRAQLAVRKGHTPTEQSLSSSSSSSTLPTAVSHRLDQLCDVVRR